MVQKDLKMCKNARFNKGPISSRTFKKVQKGPKRFKKVQESSMCLKKDREGSNGFSRVSKSVTRFFKQFEARMIEKIVIGNLLTKIKDGSSSMLATI